MLGCCMDMRMYFRTAAQKTPKFPFWSFGLVVLNNSLACWCTAMGLGLLVLHLPKSQPSLGQYLHPTWKVVFWYLGNLMSDHEKWKEILGKSESLMLRMLFTHLGKEGQEVTSFECLLPTDKISLKEIFYCISVIQICRFLWALYGRLDIQCQNKWSVRVTHSNALSQQWCWVTLSGSSTGLDWKVQCWTWLLSVVHGCETNVLIFLRPQREDWVRYSGTGINHSWLLEHGGVTRNAEFRCSPC